MPWAASRRPRPVVLPVMGRHMTQVWMAPPPLLSLADDGAAPRELICSRYGADASVEGGSGHALAKQWRGLATRYDKLAITYRAAVTLCAIFTWLRA